MSPIFWQLYEKLVCFLFQDLVTLLDRQMVPIINRSLLTHVEIKTAAFSSNKSILGIWTSFVADMETFSQDLGPYFKKIKWPF